MKKAVFTVETISAGQGEVLVYVEDPAGHREEAKVTANNDKNRTYSVFYVPKVTGQHKVPINVYLKKMKPKTAQKNNTDILNKGSASPFGSKPSCLVFNRPVSVLLGDSAVCRATHLQEPVWGGCGNGSGRLQQGHCPGPRTWACWQHCQQGHILWCLHRWYLSLVYHTLWYFGCRRCFKIKYIK